MYFENDYDESTWRAEAEARERDLARRDARDMADWYAPVAGSELPAIMADAAGPIGMELSTLSTLRARFGKRVA